MKKITEVQKQILFVIIGLLLAIIIYFGLRQPIGDLHSDQAQVIVDFYKGYLDSSNRSVFAKEHSIFSSSLNELLQKDRKICEEKAPGEICGWGAEGDPFTNSQDYESINFQDSGFKVLRSYDNQVEVKFSIAPPEPLNDREIQFKMINENGKWLVDDLVFKNEKGQFEMSLSMRTEILDEIDSFSPEAP